MGKFRYKLARFMYGRYGTDQLYHATFVFVFVLLIADLFVRNPIASMIMGIVEFLLIFWCLFRCFSRNVYKRQRENAVFCRVFKRIGNYFRFRKAKFKNRKTHVFRKCPTCRNQLRLPKQKGRHTVNCPCCKNRFEVKI